MTLRQRLLVVIIILLNCTTLAMAAPSYSDNSTNSTLAGEPALFSLKISDAGGLGGYIFSTNNSGTWANDSLVSFGSTVPWNSWTNEGTLLESFNNSAEWTQEGSIVVFDDTSNYVEGSSSIGIFTGTEPTLAIRKTINLNLSSAKNFYFWFYTDRRLNPDSTPYSGDEDSEPAITVYFASNSSALDDDTTYFSCSIFGSELKKGWNKIVIDKDISCWTNASIPESWLNNMTSMQFRIFVSDATNTTVNIDNLRYDYDGGALSKAVVILAFDDGWSETIDVAYPIMNPNGQVGVSFVNPEPIIGEWDDYMHLPELTTLYNAGWDISSHSWSHAHLNSTLSPAELELEIVESKNWLDQNGFTRGSGFFAYPFHEYDDTVLSYVNSTYKLARNDFGAEAQPHIHVDDPDNIPFLIKATEVLNSTTSDYILSVIDRAILQKSLLVLSFHKINDTLVATDDTAWSVSNFETVSNYLNDRAGLGLLDVMTFSEYYNAISNKPSTAWSNVTKILNNTVNSTIKWCVYAKNTTDSWSSSCADPFSLVTDAPVPVSYDAVYSPDTVYNPAAPLEFNISWNSTIGVDKVLITVWNSTSVIVNNLSMTLISGDPLSGVYSYNVSLPAGTYNWTSYANDTFGKMGSSYIWPFNITKAPNMLDLYINEYANQDVEVVYGTQTNVTGVCTAGTCSLYRNGDLSTDNNTNMTLAAEMYQYILFATETQNYTGNSTSYNLTVARAPNPIHLYLNGTEYEDNKNITIVYGMQTNMTGTCTIGSCGLFRSGPDGNGLDASLDNNTEKILGAGSWEYLLTTPETQNFSGNSTSYNITVEKGTPVLSIDFSPSNTVEKGTQSTVTGIENNEGDSDVNYTLYRGDAQVDNPDIAALDINTYMYTFNSTEGENWTAGSVTAPFAVQAVNIVYIPSGGGGGGSTITYTSSEDNETEESSDSSFLAEDTTEIVTNDEGETCIEDWTCLDWSECSDGMQDRACFDLNSCGTVSNKPVESQECEQQSSFTGLFTLVTSPIVIGIMALVVMVVIFIFLPVREKFKF
jgi:peptidoglycan/xylan/chitin deacetylase (PgdA/CDA1 family)